jgi:hypothetical protein
MALSAMTSAHAYLTTKSEATQDPAALLRSMTRKNEWHYSRRSVVLAKAGKERATRELCKRLGIRGVACGEKLIPL